MSKGDISLYVDAMLIETALGDPNALAKTAQSAVLSGLSDMVKSYFSAHFDPSNKTDSIINMLAPGAISTIFRLFGAGKLGLLFGLVASTLHLDVAGMIHSLLNSLRGTIEGGKQVTPGQLNGAINEAVQEHTAPLSPGEVEPSSPAGDTAFDKREFNKELQNARLLRLAMERYEHDILQLTKEAAPPQRRGDWFSSFNTRRAYTGSLLGRILGFIFETILMAGGLMVAGDVTNKLLGRPNAIDKTIGVQPTEAVAPSPVATQSKFPLNPSYQPETPPRPWTVNVPNDPGSIENMLVGFTKDVYSGLDGKEGLISNSPAFQAVKQQITWYNHMAVGEPFVYIPQMFANKKAIVDRYIGEVAKNAP